MTSRSILTLLAVAAAAIAAWAAPPGAPPHAPAPLDAGEFVAPDGGIRLPVRDFRAEWAHLGTYVVPAEQPKGMGFHDVYTQPQAVAAYKRDGVFPDGTVIVKEVRAMHTDVMTTGEASRAGQIAMWFVMIKDAAASHPDHPLWGKGWGWALFEPGDPPVNVATDFKADCLGCHLPARATDWIFTEGYPSLKP